MDTVKRYKNVIVNVFAVTTIPFLLYVVPRQLNSLHPGADGNPAFSVITAAELRYILYPAMIVFIALSFWLYNLLYRYKKTRHLLDHK